MNEPQFPTLHCRCKDGHQWASLIPKYWFRLSDVQCPVCFGPAVDMKAGDWRSLDKIKNGICTSNDESETNSS